MALSSHRSGISRLTEPEVSENDQYDDYDPDDVEDVHAVPPCFIDSSRREPPRLVDLGPTGVLPMKLLAWS